MGVSGIRLIWALVVIFHLEPLRCITNAAPFVHCLGCMRLSLPQVTNILLGFSPCDTPLIGSDVSAATSLAICTRSEAERFSLRSTSALGGKPEPGGESGAPDAHAASITRRPMSIRRAIDLTRHKISCREPDVASTEGKAWMANTHSVDRKLARGQLHRLVRCIRVKSLFISEHSCPDTADTTADESGRIPRRILSAETV